VSLFSTRLHHEFPLDVVELELLDGATYRQIFARVTLPLAGPAMITVGILAFLGSWNDLLVGLLFLPDLDMRTITVGIGSLAGLRDSNVELTLTGCLFSALPPVVGFLIFQRYLVNGITAGISR
jgi:ABC-type glycerol-3-phosphate transport system permease component